jgi:predicted Zn-dependent protease
LELLEDKEGYGEALRSAAAAYNLAPLDVEVVRAFAKILNRVDPPQAVTVWGILIELSGGAAEDRLGLAQSSLAIGRLDIAADNLALLEALIPNDPDYLFAKASFLASGNRYEDAVKVAKQMLDGSVVPEKAHFFYVRLTQLSPSVEDRREGVAYLWQLGRQSDQLGLSALRNLTGVVDNDTDAIRELIRRFDLHPLAAREDFLLTLELKLRLPEFDGDDVVAQAKTIFDPGNDESLIDLGRWLNQHRLQAETVELIDEDRALQRKDLFLVYLDALAYLNRWETVGPLLDRPNAPIERIFKSLFKMRYYHALDRERRADLEWKKALHAASGNPRELWYLADYAGRLNLGDYARSALQRLTNDLSERRRAFESLLELEQEGRNTIGLLMTLRKMEVVYPTEPAISNDIAYLKLLLDRDVEEALAMAKKMVSENPLYLAHHITLALGYLKADHVALALEVLAGLQVDWKQVRPRWRLIYAAALQANGRTAEADALIVEIDGRNLLPEEYAMLKDMSFRTTN